jgi:hypothetical protein
MTGRAETLLPPPPDRAPKPLEIPRWDLEDRFTKSDVKPTWRPSPKPDERR